MDNYGNRVTGGVQEYKPQASDPDTQKEGVSFQRKTKETTPQSNVRNAERAENFQFKPLQNREVRKPMLGQQLKMKLLWLGQKILSGKARGLVTGPAIRLLNEAYQLNQPQVADKVHRLIQHFNLPMNNTQKQNFDQICQRFNGKVVSNSAMEIGAKARREGEPERALEYLANWFVSEMNSFISEPLKSLAQIEKLSENEIIDQYCLALIDVMTQSNKAGIDLSAQKKILQSMQAYKPIAANLSLKTALEQLTNRGVI